MEPIGCIDPMGDMGDIVGMVDIVDIDATGDVPFRGGKVGNWGLFGAVSVVGGDEGLLFGGFQFYAHVDSKR